MGKEIKFIGLEAFINTLILKSRQLIHEGYSVHAIGTTSDHRYVLMLQDENGNEKKIYLKQFAE